MSASFIPLSERDIISDETALREIYSRPSVPVRDKSIDYIDDFARQFIALSPFLCIGTGDADGPGDVSPRGGDPGFVHVLDEKHLAIPDRPGNNRLDTLTNLIRAPAVGLLFLIPGFEETLRINGIASITVRPDLLERFVMGGKKPRSTIVVRVAEVYLHCSKALKRSKLWDGSRHVERSRLPSWGQMVRNQGRTILPSRLIDFAIEQDARKNLY